MPVSREQLEKVKDDLRRFVESESELPEISDQGKRAVEQLAQLGADPGFLDRLAEDDAELAEIARAVKHKVDEIANSRSVPIGFPPPIKQVGHFPILEVERGQMTVRLGLVAGNEGVFEIAQDLEDTLWLGMMVVEAVQESMVSMKETLNPATARDNLGDQLADRLGRLERALVGIRRLRDDIEHQGSP